MQFLRAWINLIFGFFFLEKLTRSSLAISRRVMSVFPQGCKTTNQSYKYFFELSIPVPEHEFSSLVSQFPSGYSGGVVFLTEGIPAWSPSSDSACSGIPLSSSPRRRGWCCTGGAERVPTVAAFCSRRFEAWPSDVLVFAPRQRLFVVWPYGESNIICCLALWCEGDKHGWSFSSVCVTAVLLTHST